MKTKINLIGLVVLAFIATIPVTLGIITGTTPRAEFTCNGSDTTFDFTFPLTRTSDLKVYKLDTSTAVQTLLSETTDYTVSATNNDYSSGGTITTVSTYGSTIRLVALRSVPVTQSANFEDSGVLRVEALENALDKLTMLVEQQQEIINRCIKFPETDSSSISSVLPGYADRASTSFVFDANGAPSVE